MLFGADPVTDPPVTADRAFKLKFKRSEKTGGTKVKERYAPLRN